MPKLTAKQIDRYRRDPGAFIEEQLIDPITNKPFVLLPAERAFVAHAFQIDEKTGRLRYPEQLYSTGRKGGKTGFAALMMLTTVLLFGEPICRRLLPRERFGTGTIEVLHCHIENR